MPERKSLEGGCVAWIVITIGRQRRVLFQRISEGTSQEGESTQPALCMCASLGLDSFSLNFKPKSFSPGSSPHTRTWSTCFYKRRALFAAPKWGPSEGLRPVPHRLWSLRTKWKLCGHVRSLILLLRWRSFRENSANFINQDHFTLFKKSSASENRGWMQGRRESVTAEGVEGSVYIMMSFLMVRHSYFLYHFNVPG